MARQQPPAPPPRLSGDRQTDLVLMLDWLNDLYQGTILSNFFLSKWPFGTAQISGAVSTFTIHFADDEPDTNYNLSITAADFSGGPPAAAFVVVRQFKAIDGCVVQVASAPGSGNSITFNWHLRR